MGQGERRRIGAGKISRAASFCCNSGGSSWHFFGWRNSRVGQEVIPAATATTGNFPVSVQSGDGTVRIPAQPERILSLSADRDPDIVRHGSGQSGGRGGQVLELPCEHASHKVHRL